MHMVLKFRCFCTVIYVVMTGTEKENIQTKASINIGIVQKPLGLILGNVIKIQRKFPNCWFKSLKCLLQKSFLNHLQFWLLWF